MVDLALGLEAFLAALRLLRLSRLFGLPTRGQPKTGSDSWHKSEHLEAAWGRIATPETVAAGLAGALGSADPGGSSSIKILLKSSLSSAGRGVKGFGQRFPHLGR